MASHAAMTMARQFVPTPNRRIAATAATLKAPYRPMFIALYATNATPPVPTPNGLLSPAAT